MATNTIGAIFTLNDSGFRQRITQNINSTRQMRNGLDDATNSTRNLGQSSGILGGSLGSLATKALGVATAYLSVKSAVGLFKDGLNQTSSMEQYKNTLETVMKSSQKASEAIVWATNFANKTPYETGDVIDATVKLTSYGMVAKDVLGGIGDMSSVMGKGLDQAVEAIADAQSGELERLKEFGIKKQDVIDEAAKTMKGKEIVNSKGQITDQEGFNKALFSLMDTRFKGGMDKQSTSYKGLMSTITGVWKTGLGNIMGVTEDGSIRAGSMFEGIKNKVKIVADTVQAWSNNGSFTLIGNRIESIGKQFNILSNKYLPKVKTGIGLITKIVTDLYADAKPALTWIAENGFNVISGTIETVWSVSKKTFDFINDNWSTIKPLVEGLVIAWGTYKAITLAITGVTKGMAIAQLALNMAMSANPMGLVITAIGLLIGAGILLYQNWDTVKQVLSDTWVSIKNTFANGANVVIDLLNKLRSAMGKPMIAKIAIEQTETEKRNSFDAVRGIGNNADGTDNWRGGLSWVGERGPELLNLPKGSQVIPNHKVLNSPLMGIVNQFSNTPNNGNKTQSIIQNVIPPKNNPITDLTQSIVQKLNPFKSNPIIDLIQTVRQSLIPANVEQIEPINQNINQNVIPPNISPLADLSQNIKQSLNPANIEQQPKSLYQNIKQKLIPFRSQPISDVTQKVKEVPYNRPEINNGQTNTNKNISVTIQNINISSESGKEKATALEIKKHLELALANI